MAKFTLVNFIATVYADKNNIDVFNTEIQFSLNNAKVCKPLLNFETLSFAFEKLKTFWFIE